MNRTGSIYLILKPKGYSTLSARSAIKAPSTKGNEVAIKLDLVVPEALFKKPQLVAKIALPDTGTTISADVLDNFSKQFAAQTGLTVTVDVVEKEEMF